MLPQSWSGRGRDVWNNVIAGIITTAILSAGAWFFGRFKAQSASLAFAAGGVLVGMAGVVIGQLVWSGISRGTRRALRRQVIPVKQNEDQYPVQRSIEVEIVSAERGPMGWPAFIRGVTRLQTQIDSVSSVWRPGLVVAINEGGIHLADRLKLDGTPLGTAHLIGGRSGRQLAPLDLPDLASPGELNVLLVDDTMKSGGSLELVANELTKRGFDKRRIRAAALVLANLAHIPASLEPVDLLPLHFPQRDSDEPLTYKEWLGRLKFVSYLCGGIPIPPWRPVVRYSS